LIFINLINSNLQQHGFQVYHKYNFVDPHSGAHKLNVERMWGSAKWGNKKCRRTDKNFFVTWRNLCSD